MDLYASQHSKLVYTSGYFRRPFWSIQTLRICQEIDWFLGSRQELIDFFIECPLLVAPCLSNFIVFCFVRLKGPVFLTSFPWDDIWIKTKIIYTWQMPEAKIVLMIFSKDICPLLPLTMYSSNDPAEVRRVGMCSGDFKMTGRLSHFSPSKYLCECIIPTINTNIDNRLPFSLPDSIFISLIYITWIIKRFQVDNERSILVYVNRLYAKFSDS